MCNSSQQLQDQKQFNFVQTGEAVLYALNGGGSELIIVTVYIENMPIKLELDTGSTYSIMALNTFEKNFKSKPIEKTSIALKSYTGEPILPTGRCDLCITYNGKTDIIKFLIIKGGGPPLLGRNFITTFKPKVAEIFSLETDQKEEIVQIFKSLFDCGLGRFIESKAKLNLKDEARPKFCKPRPVPLAIKPKVEKKLNHLVNIGVLKPVTYSDWGTPIVPVLKKNGEVRICGDFKITVNPNLIVEKYPLPRIEDIFAKLEGGVEFSKLDMSMAYQQIELDDQAKEFTTISTAKGLFQYNRLVYGLASAPAIFQKIMDKLLTF
ncbi:uncharacterized protein K02A2.6-like [Teleopsis dalmanni]|uniref:uncharacterized protein K02A2.6-like n=1 Tax=Teleopsis dalmanni TaxID=139649 RepID=UPI0018CD0FEA|nr:uncharacterized protein K02A2.6-like [Teleopsis dalmanni]